MERLDRPSVEASSGTPTRRSRSASPSPLRACKANLADESAAFVASQPGSAPVGMSDISYERAQRATRRPNRRHAAVATPSGVAGRVSPRRAARRCVDRALRRPQPLVVGSKRFTESYMLGEIVRQTLRGAGHRRRCTARAWATPASSSRRSPAARSTSIPSTPARSCASCSSASGNPSLAELNDWLAPRGLKAAVPLGFNNTYALAMLESRAAALGIAHDLRPARARGRGPAARAVARVPASAPTAGRP